MHADGLIYTGLRDIAPQGDDEIPLSKDDLFLVRPNERLLSERWNYLMSEQEFTEAATASRYLVCKYPTSVPGLSDLQAKAKGMDRFYAGLMALQIIKPLQTLGFIYYSGTESRPKMEPSRWALEKHFDNEMLARVPELIDRTQRVMDGDNAERKNALSLLQHGLEHFHPLIAGLFWVMGIEAILGSADRKDFERKLCRCLGADTFVFPKWTDLASAYTVKAIAVHLYVLRNMLVHGIDLRKAENDRSTPVNLMKQVQPDGFSEPTVYAVLLSEAALSILCQVLKKEL